MSGPGNPQEEIMPEEKSLFTKGQEYIESLAGPNRQDFGINVAVGALLERIEKLESNLETINNELANGGRVG